MTAVVFRSRAAAFLRDIFFMRLLRCAASSLLVALLLTGCDQLSLPKARAKVEEQAAQAQRTADYPRAIRLYESILDGTRETAKVHYNLALIYDDKLKDPVSALHHFRRYLKLSDDAASRKEVQRFIDRIQLSMAAAAADGGVMTKKEAARLKNDNLKLQEQVARLQTELAEARRKPTAKELARAAAFGKTQPERDARGFSTVPATAAAEKVVGKETRTYVVQKGDTLASIARKFYKSGQRWKDIADANQNQLNGTVDLKVGQTLIIPQ